MNYDKGEQMTVGGLRNFLNCIPDNTKVYVGFGECVKPLRYLSEHGGDLLLQSDVYGANAHEHNIETILKLHK